MIATVAFEGRRDDGQGAGTAIEGAALRVPFLSDATMILTPGGERPAGALRLGDRVETRDRGPRPIRWIGVRPLGAFEARRFPALAPVRIAAGALGPNLPTRDLVMSPRHRVLVAGPRAEIFFGEDEVLVAALHLVGQPGIERLAPQPVLYRTFLFDRHEILCTNGLWTESFQPEDPALEGIGQAQREELAQLFPAIAAAQGFAPARRALRVEEARALLPAR